MSNNTSASEITTSYLPARILAALIDYFFILSTASFFQRFYSLEDLNFLIFIGLAAFYYTIANSKFFNGQTLGKKFFGLRTVSVSNNDASGYISLTQSLLRFLIILGLTIALKEVPPIFYRQFLVEASRSILDIPLLFALVMLFGNIGTLLIHTHQRGLHDILGGSIVIRDPNNEAIKKLNVKLLESSYYHPAIGFAAGSALALIFWLLSITQPAQLQAVSEQQYKIEASLQIKLLHATFYNTTLSLITLVDPQAKSIDLSCKDTLQKTKALLEADLDPQLINAIEMRCIDKTEHSSDITLKLDFASNEIAKVETIVSKSDQAH